MAVAMGFAYAAVDTYLFLRLKELGGDGYVMGTAAVVQIISELPCFWWRCVAQPAQFGLRKRRGLLCKQVLLVLCKGDTWLW